MSAELASLLERLADALENGPVHIVGARISVSGGQGGSATGLNIVVTGGAPGTASTGMRIEVSDGDYNREAPTLAKEAREAATLLREGRPPASWLQSIVNRAGGLGNKFLDSLVSEAGKKVIEYGAGTA